MTSPELEELFNKEVDRRVTEILSVWVEKISSTHRGIDIEVLLRDLPESVSDSHFSKGRCRGVIKGGARCSRLGKNGGYCGFHLNQKKKICPVIVESKFAHTHDMSIQYMDDCPACIASKNITQSRPSSSRNELIDLDNIV
jgi:hypothetical protein|tara:strand:- start:43 stop:465 length:423 start_codon:yes stop_codon:yes gene_type:complete